ncbi:endonuclease/exonuclease/phosphatase family protein [Bacillus sp. V5-8f]|uniref:endonuclease/exonuclease/phosphatase family protein n=1 Tax=Bacillus sp. V5-8f TaxID=2053044 RepID=UPI000C7580D7|nr:endonuclease/exonuclease/phosphatase family protein [Bacillus sp. V5-8f]PLT35645.1 endonuclease [Bacillus sp. V5-8f]
MHVKVMTFNIHQGRGIDRKLDLKRISNVIRQAKADIIGLNEVDRYFSERSDFTDQALFLADQLKMEYVYGPAVTIETPGAKPHRQFGNALLTRFPILQSCNHPFDFLPRITEDRALLEVKLKVGEHKVWAFVTHLSLAPFLHKKQSAFILDVMKKKTGPAFVMGDWNMSPVSKAWRQVTQHLADVWTENNPSQRGYTFPSKRPFRRLDYIFSTKEIIPIHSEVITLDKSASDHLPMMATLKIE